MKIFQNSIYSSPECFAAFTLPKRDPCHDPFPESGRRPLEKGIQMSRWTVEIDNDFLNEVRLWSKDRQLELFSIQERLASGGPEAMGLLKSELEGVPDWRHLSTPYCLPLAVSLPSGWKILTLEIQPKLRVIIVRLE